MALSRTLFNARHRDERAARRRAHPDAAELSSSRRSAPTAIALRPASRSARSAPTSSRRQPGERAHVGLGLAAPGRRDDQLELGARRDQLVGEPGLERARAQQRLGQRDQRRVAGIGAPARLVARDRRRLAGRPAIASRICVAAPADPGGMDAADLLEAADVRGLALGQLDERRVGQRPSRPAGPRARRCARATRPARGRRRGRAGRAGRPRAGAPRRSRGRARRSRTRAGGTPRAPTRDGRVSRQAALELVGELEQVGDVLGGVAELLGGQRAGVPAGVAGGLADAPAEDRAEQVAVAGLGARAGETGGELGVEDVVELGAATTRRRIATSWRPAWSTISISGSASSSASGVTSTAFRARRSGRSAVPAPSASGSSTAIWTRHSSAR